MKNTYLMYVDGKVQNSNKFYNMFPKTDGTFKVEYGRVGNSPNVTSYPIGRWNSIYRSKLRKGYEDITKFKVNSSVVKKDSGNIQFDEFYDSFLKYINNSVRSTYMGDGCTPSQLKEAQNILNSITNLNKVDDINDHLMMLFKVIPRRMSNVKDYLYNPVNNNEINVIVNREQNALDSMDSSNIAHVNNPYKELGIEFKEGDSNDYKIMLDLITPTMGYHKVSVYKVYKIKHYKNQEKFDNWLDNQNYKNTQYLIHGTRNPNIFSILKSGLMIRPTNAAQISGAAYGNGIYHSAHTAKSLGYTGYDNDKIFFIQNVHMGREYTYSGWYRDNKDISRSDMNYKGLKNKGYDSLFVKPGDGLLNSEYIVYREEQTVTSYIVWMK